MLFRWAHAATAALCLNQAAAYPGKSSGPVQVLETRRHQESFGRDALWGLRRDLTTAGLQQRGSDTDIYRTNGSLDLSWSDAKLYSYGAATVSCASCYVKGTAYASLVVEGDFNVTQALSEFHTQFLPEVKNITEDIWHQLEDWADYVYTNITGTVEDEVVQFFNDGDIDDFDICWDCYAFPSFNESFDLNLTDIPETTLRLEFDDLELYMMLDLTLEAEKTYEIDLYPKVWPQPAGFHVGDQEVGVIISLQLILQINAQVDISTGVHVGFDDGLAIEIAMFGTDVSTIHLTDGHFEFLPVTVNVTGITFDATLRLGVTTGLNMSADLGDIIKMGAGASATVYTDLAHFNTNITFPEASAELSPRDDDCLMPIIESYELGLGAQAGAFVQFDNDEWGPTPETSIQIFYTTLFSACAASPAAATNTAAALAARETTTALLAERDDLTTSPVSTVYTITNVICMSAGLRNCPASLQSTIQVTSDSTIDMIVSKGVEAVFPPTTTAGKVTAVPFGIGAQRVQGSSGSPVSYVPPTSTASASGSSSTSTGGVAADAKKTYNGLSEKDKKLVIGLCAGLGGALLGVAAFAVWCCVKRRKPGKQSDMAGSNVEDVHGPDASQPFLGESEPKAKWQQTQVNITESSGPTTPRHE
ncbi:hypothetical protein VMCG_05620 [Cytospora schulzeri]|uniref:Peptidase A1 domain-containing protein n=1 Tax=Cytospora schulzeri TaxID=448051 RepID=A0A423WET4_9PEZI|nr:hypothetical protein VMCG_05620 [Valsa malicola]